jgi:hypothetical protein
MTNQEVRNRAGRSREWVAVHAGVSAPTVRVFEIGGPEAVSDKRKRDAIASVYQVLRQEVGNV